MPLKSYRYQPSSILNHNNVECVFEKKYYGVACSTP